MRTWRRTHNSQQNKNKHNRTGAEQHTEQQTVQQAALGNIRQNNAGLYQKGCQDANQASHKGGTGDPPYFHNTSQGQQRATSGGNSSHEAKKHICPTGATRKWDRGERQQQQASDQDHAGAEEGTPFPSLPKFFTFWTV